MESEKIKKFLTYGFTSNGEKCIYCSSTETRIEPRFLYPTCIKHFEIPPVKQNEFSLIKELSKKNSGGIDEKWGRYFSKEKLVEMLLWFEEKVVVQGHPDPVWLKKTYGKENFILISVSGNLREINRNFYKENNIEYHWFPMTEVYQMGIHSLYGVLRIFDIAFQENKKLLIHCDGGVNRSVTAAEFCLSFYFGIGKIPKYFYKSEMLIGKILDENIYRGKLPSTGQIEVLFHNLRRDIRGIESAAMLIK